MAAPGNGFVPGRHPIEAIGRGGFLFAGMSHVGSLLALPSGVQAWPVADFGALTPETLAPLLAEADALDFVLIGTGKSFVPLGADLRSAFTEAGVRFEAMSTSSATQTYNILLDEGRKVAAALIAVA